MRGLGGYSGSDAQSDALTQEVKACLTTDEADLQAAEAIQRATSLKAKEDAQEKVKARDLLERRLLLVFNEVRAVEDAMLALYERVEQATQYVFSGQSYRELLVWASS